MGMCGSCSKEQDQDRYNANTILSTNGLQSYKEIYIYIYQVNLEEPTNAREITLGMMKPARHMRYRISPEVTLSWPAGKSAESHTTIKYTTL